MGVVRRLSEKLTGAVEYPLYKRLNLYTYTVKSFYIPVCMISFTSTKEELVEQVLMNALESFPEGLILTKSLDLILSPIDRSTWKDVLVRLQNTSDRISLDELRTFVELMIFQNDNSRELNIDDLDNVENPLDQRSEFNYMSKEHSLQYSAISDVQNDGFFSNICDQPEVTQAGSILDGLDLPRSSPLTKVTARNFRSSLGSNHSSHKSNDFFEREDIPGADDSNTSRFNALEENVA
jgi:hypothetical protein